MFANILTLGHSETEFFAFLDLKSDFIKYTIKIVTQHHSLCTQSGFILTDISVNSVALLIPPFTLIVKQPALSLPPVTGGSIDSNPMISGHGPFMQSDSLTINFDIRRS